MHLKTRRKRSHANLRDGLPFHSLQAQIYPIFVVTEIVLQITTQKITYKTSFHPSSMQTVETSTTM
jgi:hypothetical protein